MKALKRRLELLRSADAVRFYLLVRIARLLLPTYRLRWNTLNWWQNTDFNSYLAQFGELNSFNSDRRWIVHQLLRLIADVEGDTAECGVFEGATSYLICKANQHTSRFTRTHFMFDSFAGLSDPVAQDGTYWRKGDLATHEDIARARLQACERAVFMKGWIPDRFHEVARHRFAFVHIDVDLYQPTLDSIEFFYPRLNDGGVMIIDDFGFTNCPGAAMAVAASGIQDQVLSLPDGGGFLIKGTSVEVPAVLA
jgi:hypothetical protein